MMMEIGWGWCLYASKEPEVCQVGDGQLRSSGLRNLHRALEHQLRDHGDGNPGGCQLISS